MRLKSALALALFLAACPGKTSAPDAGVACGAGCPIHESCVNGSCQCLQGWKLCPGADGGSSCAQIEADGLNCGACGVACQAGESCLGGSCQCTAVLCPGPDGGQLCSDLQSDPANCSQCGQACPVNERCVGGLCQCPAGNSTCPLPDGGLLCTSLSTDPMNCGQCAAFCDGGNCQCDPTSQACVAPAAGSPGVCTCLGTLASCGAAGGGCVDLNSDPANCGGCGQLCASGSCAGGVCLCGPPFTKCGTDCTGLDSDVHHCGSCSTDCTLGLGAGVPDVSCSQGSCACGLDGGIATGMLCLATGGSAGACVDPTADPQNCGACGHGCSQPTTACSGGNCACPGSTQLCIPDGGAAGSGSCEDTTSSTQNCGGCGKDCSVDYAASSLCKQGRCGCSDVQVVCITQAQPPLCGCQAADGGSACLQPKIAFANVAAILNDQSSLLGCATSGCHSAASHAGSLDLSTPAAAYAGLLGSRDGGTGSSSGCDGGPTGGFGSVASMGCPCTARVVPGMPAASYLIQSISNSAALCAGGAPMPIDADGGYHSLSACEVQLLTIWVAQGASGS